MSSECPSNYTQKNSVILEMCGTNKSKYVFSSFVPLLELGAKCRRGRLEARPLVILEADPGDLRPRLSMEIVVRLGLDPDGLELPVQAEHCAEAGLHDPLLRLQLHDPALFVLNREKHKIEFAPEN